MPQPADPLYNALMGIKYNPNRTGPAASGSGFMDDLPSTDLNRITEKRLYDDMKLFPTIDPWNMSWPQILDQINADIDVENQQMLQDSMNAIPPARPPKPRMQQFPINNNPFRPEILGGA